MQRNKETKVKTAKVRSSNTPLSNIQLLLLIGSILIITFFSFSPALKNSFINWDDNAYVFENLNLNKPFFEAIPFFFGPHYFIGNYIPLTMITYAAEFHAVGIDPPFFHLVNVLVHLLNEVLVFWFIWLLSGRKAIVAFIVALFFGIHPMHVESVAWVAELKDVLYSCFFLAGLVAYCVHILPGSRGEVGKPNSLMMLFLAFVFFIFSTLSKPAAVIFPFVLLSLDFYIGRKFDKRLWIEKIPFFVVSIIFGAIAVKAQAADRLLHDYYPFYQRVFFASHSLLDYLAKFVLPVHLSIFYPYPPLIDGHLPYFYYITPLLVIALFYGVYRTLKYTRVIAFGALFFFINLLLVLQLLSVGDAVMADRYTYIPYIGLLFILAMEFDSLYRSTGEKLKTWRTVAVTAITIFAVTCSYLTYARCQVWENDETIATDLVEKYPDDRLALNNKGFVLYNQGRFPEAVEYFTKAIRIKPDYAMAYINLVNVYLKVNDTAKAMAVIDLALKSIPGDFNILNAKGYLLSNNHQYPEAIEYCRKAISVKKDDIDAYIYLAGCYLALNDYSNWVKTLDEGLTFGPDNFVLLNNKGYSLFVKGKYSEALEYYKASLKMKPDFQTALINLQNCYKAMGDASGTIK